MQRQAKIAGALYRGEKLVNVGQELEGAPGIDESDFKVPRIEIVGTGEAGKAAANDQDLGELQSSSRRRLIIASPSESMVAVTIIGRQQTWQSST